MNRLGNVLSRIHRRLNLSANAVSSLTVIVLMFLLVADIVGRHLFGGGVKGADELAEQMMALIVFMPLAITQMVRGHIRIEVLTNRFSPRSKVILEAFAYAAGMFLMSLIGWRLVLFAWEAYQTMAPTMGKLATPVFPYRFVASFGCFLLAFQYFTDVVEHLITVARWKQTEASRMSKPEQAEAS